MYDPSILPTSNKLGCSVVYVPHEVERFYKSPHLDAVGIALRYIDDLPADFRATLSNYLDVGEIEDVRTFYSGMRKLRDGEEPTKNEILILGGPEGRLRHLSDGFLDAAANEPLGPAQYVFVEKHICKPLKAAASFIKRTPLLVKEWAKDLADERYPDDGYPGEDKHINPGR